jgi:hypothetical protein
VSKSDVSKAFIEINDILQNPGLDIDLNQTVDEDLGGIGT